MATTAKITLEVDAGDAQRTFQGAVSQFTSGLDKVKEAGLRTFEVFTGVSLARVFETGLAALRDFVAESTKLGLSAQTQGDAFAQLTKSLGVSGDELLAQLKAASGGIVDETQVIQAAGRALQEQLDPAQIVNLMTVARQAAKFAGVDVADAFSQITEAIANQTPRALKHMGIIIDLTQAHETYAHSLNRNVAELNVVGQAQALYNAVMTRGAPLVETLSTGVRTNTEVLQSAKAAWQEFQVGLGRVAAEALVAAIRGFGDIRGTLETVKTAILDFVETEGLALMRFADVIMRVAGVVGHYLAPLGALFTAVKNAASALAAGMSFRELATSSVEQVATFLDGVKAKAQATVGSMELDPAGTFARKWEDFFNLARGRVAAAPAGSTGGPGGPGGMPMISPGLKETADALYLVDAAGKRTQITWDQLHDAVQAGATSFSNQAKAALDGVEGLIQWDDEATKATKTARELAATQNLASGRTTIDGKVAAAGAPRAAQFQKPILAADAVMVDVQAETAAATQAAAAVQAITQELQGNLIGAEQTRFEALSAGYQNDLATYTAAITLKYGTTATLAATATAAEVAQAQQGDSLIAAKAEEMELRRQTAAAQTLQKQEQLELAHVQAVEAANKTIEAADLSLAAARATGVESRIAADAKVAAAHLSAMGLEADAQRTLLQGQIDGTQAAISAENTRAATVQANLQREIATLQDVAARQGALGDLDAQKQSLAQVHALEDQMLQTETERNTKVYELNAALEVTVTEQQKVNFEVQKLPGLFDTAKGAVSGFTDAAGNAVNGITISLTRTLDTWGFLLRQFGGSRELALKAWESLPGPLGTPGTGGGGTLGIQTFAGGLDVGPMPGSPSQHYPAWLSGGEWVMLPDQIRTLIAAARATGTGDHIEVHVHDPVVRTDQDPARIAAAVAQALSNRRRRGADLTATARS